MVSPLILCGKRPRTDHSAGTEAESTGGESREGRTEKRIAEMRKFLREQDTKVMGYDEQLVRRLIGKVTVYDKRFEVEFKSGVKVDVER